ncbi:MAG: hypothetical protein K6G00_00340 [Treponema sp.]|nr:hypothetical protein [Treponema sp.]
MTKTKDIVWDFDIDGAPDIVGTLVAGVYDDGRKAIRYASHIHGKWEDFGETYEPFTDFMPKAWIEEGYI